MTEPVLPLVAGLIGWPVAHSKSPRIHSFWLARCGIDGSYVRLPVRPGAVAAALRGLSALGFVGVQATMPHKRAARACMDTLSSTAAALGVVNTVLVGTDGALHGHNTDIAGFLEPLADLDLRGGSVTVLGAGGAAAAVVAGLATKGPARINIVNRSHTAVDQLLADIGPLLGTIEVVVGTWDQAPALASSSALLVNATSLGMHGAPALPLDAGTLNDTAVVYDIITHPAETALLRSARARGLRCHDGIEMLIGQAREAFALFYGVAAPTDADAALRAALTS